VAAHWVLSQIYVIQGRPQDALPEIELVRYDPVRAFLHPIVYYALGRKKESDAALNELITKHHASNPYEIAQVYAFRNQPDEAFEWLGRAYAQREDQLTETKVDPLLKNLHSDPRFAALLKKLNLPKPEITLVLWAILSELNSTILDEIPPKISYRSQACRRSSPATAAQAISTGSGIFQRNSTARLTAQINMVGRS